MTQAVFFQNLLNNILKARVQHRTDTESNWASANPVLLKGEFAIVAVSPTVVKFKVGDGAQNFNALPYCGNDLSEAFEIHRAGPATNPGSPQGGRVYEATQAGTYIHFLDENNDPIEVTGGEFVRIIDEGTYFTKLVIPISGSVTDGVYDLFYGAKPSLPVGGTAIFDKSAITHITAVPTAGDWYVDPSQSFDLSRLHEVVLLAAGATGILTVAIVTINSVGTLAILDSTNIATTNGVPSIVNLRADAAYYTDPVRRTALKMRAYIAVKNHTNQPLLTAASFGRQTWQFDGTSGANTAKLLNTDINYEVSIMDFIPLQRELTIDQSVTPIRHNIGDVDRMDPNNDSTLLFTTSGVNGTVYLPRYGVEDGKTFTIRFAAGFDLISITVEDGGTIDGTLPGMGLIAAGEVARLQHIGGDYWLL